MDCGGCVQDGGRILKWVDGEWAEGFYVPGCLREAVLVEGLTLNSDES